MVSYQEGVAQSEWAANQRKQRNDEPDHAYVMRRVNIFSPLHRHFLHLTPSEAFTSVRGGDEEIIPPGYLVGIEKARMIGSRMLPSTDVAKQLKHALRQTGIADIGVSHTSKGVWVGHATVAGLHSAVNSADESRTARDFDFLQHIGEKGAGRTR